MTANSNLDGLFPEESQKRSLWSALMQMVVDRNPFYLLSAACMLAGCLALTNSLSWSSLPLGRLLLLIATINFYEAALIALAILLMGRGLLRDGKILLIVEAFFLVDVTFLNAEVVTANLHVGIVIAAALFVLALLKIRLVMHALGAKMPAASFVQVMVQIAAMLAIPCVLRGGDHGSVAPIQFYAVWWVVGLMPVIGEGARWCFGDTTERLSGPAKVFIVLPWISLIAHVGILHYVYDVDYFGAMAAPMLLGFTFVLHRAGVTRLTLKKDLLVMQVLLPLAAILVSLNNPSQLVFSMPLFHVAEVTPMLLAIGGAYLTFVYCILLPIALWCLAVGVMAAGLYLFGPSAAQVQRFAWQAWAWFLDVTDWMVPKSLNGWGVLSVLASFFFLILGAAVSLTGRRTVEVIVEPPVRMEAGD